MTRERVQRSIANSTLNKYVGHEGLLCRDALFAVKGERLVIHCEIRGASQHMSVSIVQEGDTEMRPLLAQIRACRWGACVKHLQLQSHLAEW